MKKRLLLLLSMAFLAISSALAQRTITGTVKDNNGEAMVGASVVVKGTTTGTITDIDGKFSLNLPKDATAVVVSFTGFATQEIAVGTSNILDVTLSEGKVLEEAVVTAFGIKKDKSNLGYSIPTVTGDELTAAHQTNLTNALAAKIPGVRISGSGGSFTGSSVIVRGFTTFTGSNQPLYVVDGIAIDNSGGGSPLQSGPSVSNRAIDLNPEDVESISVLKGAAATTLYGSRASAGVILITTKKGRTGQKNAITYTANYGQQEVNRLPDYQNVYGQGTGGNFGVNSTASWGPKIDGRRVSLPADYRAAGVGDSVALTAYPDNVKELFQKGINQQHNLSFQGGTEKSAYRLSLGLVDDQGVLDNNRLRRYNVGIVASNEITSKLKAEVSLTYSLNTSTRTQQGNQLSNPLFRTWFTPRSWNLTGLPWTDPAGTGNQLHYELSSGSDNPRWSIYNNLYDDQINRILGNFNLRYQLTDWLSASYKIGTDNYNFVRSSYDQIGIRGAGNTGSQQIGGIRERRDNTRNVNSIFTLNASKKVGDIEINGLLGQETIDESTNSSDLIGRGLIVRDFRNLDGNTLTFIPTYSRTQRRIIGAFANVTGIYKNFATLDVSLRNDWNSTLPEGKNSYLYYSAAASVNLTEAFPSIKSEWVNLVKLRANYGRVGKGGDFLYLTDSYYGTANPADGFGPNLQFPFNGLAAFTLNNTAGNPNLRPEFTTSYEFGGEVSLWNDRISIDATSYNYKTSDVILAVPNSSAAGISAIALNAGSLTTKGLEAAISIKPIKTSKGYWETTFNYTQFESVVDELADGVANIFLGGFTTPNVRLVKGDPFGQLYGNKYLRDDQGRLKLTAGGLPQVTANVDKIGNPNARYTFGVNNTINYDGFSFSVLLDVRKGGDQYSRNIADLQRNGVAIETAEKERLNTDGTVAKPYIFEGVLPNGTVNTDSDPNAVRVTAEQYWGNSGKYVAAEGFIYETSWFRVREATLNYDFSKKFLKNTPFGAASIGLFGRNLFLYAPNYPHLDPEQNALGISNAQGLEFNALPQTRTIGANLRITF